MTYTAPAPSTARPATRPGGTDGPGPWSRLRWTGLLGLAGSLLMLVGGVGAGGTLVRDPLLSGTPFVALRFGHGQDLAVTAVYAGLALLVWAWVRLGRAVLARVAGPGTVTRSAVAWTAPMLVSVPLFTRDPYSYLAYGALPLHGFDPYSNGPRVLSGPIEANVHSFWTDTPGMYGPLFIAVAKLVAALCGDNLMAGVLLLRAILVLGLLPLAWALPRLCRHLGGDPATTNWLVLANPLTVVVLVGGAHNDLWVIGLLAAGTALVLERRSAAGVTLVTLAAAVKATAALALPFLVLVWAGRLAGGQRVRIARATVAGLSTFTVVFAFCSVPASVGWAGSPASVRPPGS